MNLKQIVVILNIVLFLSLGSIAIIQDSQLQETKKQFKAFRLEAIQDINDRDDLVSLTETHLRECNIALTGKEFFIDSLTRDVTRLQFDLETPLLETHEFLDLLRFNDKEYILNEYDCTEFSVDLALVLNSVGFRASTKVVSIDCDNWTDDWDYLEQSFGFGYASCKDNNLHEIVELDNLYIEAVTGNIIMPEDYALYGVVR